MCVRVRTYARGHMFVCFSSQTFFIVHIPIISQSRAHSYCSGRARERLGLSCCRGNELTNTSQPHVAPYANIPASAILEKFHWQSFFFFSGSSRPPPPSSNLPFIHASLLPSLSLSPPPFTVSHLLGIDALVVLCEWMNLKVSATIFFFYNLRYYLCLKVHLSAMK